MRSKIIRIPMLLVEFGVTAIGLLVAIDRLATNTSWLSDMTKGGDYLGWVLLADVILALVLALRFERQRWIRRASLTFHLALVLLAGFSVLAVHFDVFPD